MRLTRRNLLLSPLAAALAPAAARASEPFHIPTYEEHKVEYKFRKRVVEFKGDHPPGTIVVDMRKRFLYLVQEDGKAIRYGIGVGSSATRWSGTATIARMAKWPKWTPTEEMMSKHEHYDQWKDGMPGGLDNPMGARALYLINEGGKDNQYRIHGTPAPYTIGKATTSGCFRMLNTAVIDLYGRVKVGTKVVVLPYKSGL
ncbi:MAG: L,D-transpeptidase [Rhizobiales bacterium]|nr:L,D-transpeptidase [Hyphomicrobiales bacterium]